MVVDFKKARVHVVTDAIPWPAAKLRRASVNSFGFGGANAHCVLDHPSTLGLSTLPKDRTSRSSSPDSRSDYLITRTLPQNINPRPDMSTRGFHDDEAYYSSGVSTPLPRSSSRQRRNMLLPFSAHTKSSLQSNIASLSARVEKHALADLAYTLSKRRSQFAHRTFVIANQVDKKVTLDTTPRTYVLNSDAKTPSVGFVFTGQGAQWTGMGKQLFEYSVFSREIDYLDKSTLR